MQDARWKTIEAWMTAYGDSILRTVYLVTRDRAASEEIAQEVFIRAYRKLDQFENRSAPSTWLYRIAVNLARNHLRRRRDHTLDTDRGEGELPYPDAFTPAHPTPEAILVRADRAATVRSCVDALPSRLRLVVALYYLEERPIAQVAAILRLPQGTVKSRLAKARAMLHEKLETEEGHAET